MLPVGLAEGAKLLSALKTRAFGRGVMGPRADAWRRAGNLTLRRWRVAAARGRRSKSVPGRALAVEGLVGGCQFGSGYQY